MWNFIINNNNYYYFLFFYQLSNTYCLSLEKMLIIIELEPLGYWLDCQYIKAVAHFTKRKKERKKKERKKLYRQNLYYLYKLCYYHIAHKTLTCALNIKLLFDRVFFAIICHYPFTLLQDVIKSNLNLKIGRNNSTDSADIVIVMMSHYTRVWTHSLYVFSSSVDLVSKGPRATTSLVFPIRCGQQSSRQHQMAVQQPASHRNTLRLHRTDPRRSRRLQTTRLSVPQQTHAPQQRQLHAHRGE